MSIFVWHTELDDFLQELDEDVEGMQSTILFLQQELKASKDTIATLEQENNALKNDGAVLPAKNNGFNAEPIDSSNGGISANETDNTHASTTAAKQSATSSSSSSTSTPAVISNCSVVLRTAELRTSEIKLTSDRTLRKEKFNVSSKEPRTLRSTSRNMVVDEFRTKKLKLTNGSSDDLNGGGATGMVVVDGVGDSSEQKDDNLENNNFRKRSYESDSSECSNKERTNSKTNVANKKSRRSSVLSLDINDEDSRIEIDEDRTIFGNNIGTKLNHVDQPV